MNNRFSKVQSEVYKFTRVQKILISLCAFFLAFGIFARFTNGNAASKAGYDVFTMFRYTFIDNPAKTITSFSSDITSLWAVKSENDELRQKLASQKNYKTQLDESKRRVKELEALMEIQSKMEYVSTSANVLNRDIQAWSNELTIDKGSKDGIEINSAVISSNGLIGKVTEVNASTSKVQLLTTEDGENPVSVKLVLGDGKTTEGTLENFNKDTMSYNIIIYDATVEIKSGMEVVTSGTGGVFPPGILVGKVNKVEDLYNAKGKSILATPSVDFNDFTYVGVLRYEK